MKEFRTAMKTQAEQDNGTPSTVEFKIDDDVFTATRPKGSAWLFLAAAADNGDVMAGMIEVAKFLDSVLPDDQAERLNQRLRDPHDGFDLEDAINVFRFLTAEFTGRPTESQPD